MNVFSFTGLAIGILSSLMALFIFVRGRSKLHYLWGVFCISVMFWGFGGYRIGSVSNPAEALLWWRIAYTGVIFIPILFAHFVHRFLLINRPRFLYFLYGAGFIFLGLNWFTRLFIRDARLVFNEFYYISPPAPLYAPFVVLFVGLVLYTTIIFYRAYRVSEGMRRMQIKYFFIAIVAGYGGGSTSFLPVYGVDVYPVLNIGVALFPIIIGYAIFRYRLFDVRAIVARSVVYLILSTLVALIFTSLSVFFSFILRR